MSAKIKITLPELPDGADRWDVYAVTNRWGTPADPRKWYQRIAYRVLMWTHDHAETLWSWLYRKAQKVAPPRDVIVGQKYFPIDLPDSTPGSKTVSANSLT